MPRVIDSPEQFTSIGENIHATRVVLRNGRKAKTLDDGTEVVPFKGESGEDRLLTVPEWYKKTQPYDLGQIKHFLIAVMKGIGDDPSEQEEGAAYVHSEVRRQVRAGADYLDLNVDEISPKLDVQFRGIRWLVATTQSVSPLPLSVDSSNSDIIAEGLAECDSRAGRPIVNSVALERIETLDLVKEHDARVVITAAGASGMPSDDDERVENVAEVMESVRSKGVVLGDVFVDPLAFPISVDGTYGNHFFDAVRKLREVYGNEIHITGGLSNVSFGLPRRKLINDTFIYMALEAGIDSGIIDPIQSNMGTVFDLDTSSEPVKLAIDMLSGSDDFCMNYIQAFRDGKLG
ncbi:MAG: dihydropteroate synthase [SAR202 cluster bacterium]|nr:dihydropteroate synthase [SAR202 cluster bacterium]